MGGSGRETRTSCAILAPFPYSQKKVGGESLGTSLMSSLSVPSLLNAECTDFLQIKFAENITTGKELCTKKYKKGNKDDKAKLEFLRERIHESYMHQWVIDNMPVTWCYSIMESDQPYCTTRFPVGCFITPEGVKHDACYLSVSENALNVAHTWASGIAKMKLSFPSSLSLSLSLTLSFSFSLPSFSTHRTF